jgi:hypothetical protein
MVWEEIVSDVFQSVIHRIMRSSLIYVLHVICQLCAGSHYALAPCLPLSQKMDHAGDDPAISVRLVHRRQALTPSIRETQKPDRISTSLPQPPKDATGLLHLA